MFITLISILIFTVFTSIVQDRKGTVKREKEKERKKKEGNKMTYLSVIEYLISV